MVKRDVSLLPGLLLAATMAAPFAAAAPPLSVTTPLEGAYLFISPCGKPFRSTSGQPYPVVAWFNEADTNKDGKLDKAEFETDAQVFFQVLDRNGDGVINDQEISYYEHNVVPEITAGAEPSAFGAGAGRPALIPIQTAGSSGKTDERHQPRQGAALYGLLNDPEPVRSADRSLEGRITLADFTARADHNFDRLDYEGRGYLTLEGLPPTPAENDVTPMKRSKA